MNGIVERVAGAIKGAIESDLCKLPDNHTETDERIGQAALNEIITILYEWGEDQAASVLRDRARS